MGTEEAKEKKLTTSQENSSHRERVYSLPLALRIAFIILGVYVPIPFLFCVCIWMRFQHDCCNQWVNLHKNYVLLEMFLFPLKKARKKNWLLILSPYLFFFLFLICCFAKSPKWLVYETGRAIFFISSCDVIDFSKRCDKKDATCYFICNLCVFLCYYCDYRFFFCTVSICCIRIFLQAFCLTHSFFVAVFYIETDGFFVYFKRNSS